MVVVIVVVFFFFNDTATTEIYTLSLHDALPISRRKRETEWRRGCRLRKGPEPDRKSTRLNSSHHSISYAVFCLKKKKEMETEKREKEGKRERSGEWRVERGE